VVVLVARGRVHGQRVEVVLGAACRSDHGLGAQGSEEGRPDGGWYSRFNWPRPSATDAAPVTARRSVQAWAGVRDRHPPRR
jgi:hypothetical protein